MKLTSLVTNSFINVARAAYQRNLANGTNTPPYTPQSVGITPIVPQVTGPPTFNILNSVNIGTGGPYYGPANQWNFRRPNFLDARPAQHSSGRGV